MDALDEQAVKVAQLLFALTFECAVIHDVLNDQTRNLCHTLDGLDTRVRGFDEIVDDDLHEIGVKDVG